MARTDDSPLGCEAQSRRPTATALFFNATNAFFGKRMSMREVQARYSNQWVCHPLHRIVDHGVLPIVASNSQAKMTEPSSAASTQRSACRSRLRLNTSASGDPSLAAGTWPCRLPIIEKRFRTGGTTRAAKDRRRS